MGALVNSLLNAAILNIILSLIIIFAGIYVAKSGNDSPSHNASGRSRQQIFELLGIGAAAGFASGLTGVGGPVLSVPLMVIMGFGPLTAIATSQVIQIVAALSGTIGNLQYGSINFGIGAWLTILELAGVLVGVRIAHSTKSLLLRNFAASVCMLVGGIMLLRSSGIAGIVLIYVKTLL